jgi:RNA polymerase sigma factor (sigma-70 family)
LNNALSEVEIVNGCVRNERSCQEILYRRYFSTMMRMCQRHAHGDDERAMEMLNDGFIRVFKKINTFEFKGSLEGWIRRLVFHAISDYFRANRQYLDNTIFDEDALPLMMVTEEVSDQLYYEDLLKLVETLPPATRAVFQYYAIEGFNHNEIAEKLNISVGTSKWHLSTARDKLKGLIKLLDSGQLKIEIKN